MILAAEGLRQRLPEKKTTSTDTLYDLASLTKVVATTTAIMLLRDDGVLDLDRSVTEWVPIPAFKAMTLRHLLTHTAGLVPGIPMYRDATSVDAMLQRYAVDGIRREPGVRRSYSDAGFMLLGRTVEMAAQQSLDAFCKKRIFDPLEMTHTGFNPSEEMRANCAATERCSWRDEIMLGKVHDENAYAVGGVSGHAGLFSTAPDLALFCRAMLTGTLLKPETVVEMTTLGNLPFYPWQGLGWWLDPWSSELNGFLPSRTAFGHTGFTGTSMWMDRDTGHFAILLGNTCHPSRRNRKHRAFRTTFYDAVSQQLYPHSRATHTGVDRLLRTGFRALEGKRVALLTNHAAVDQQGRHILEVLRYAPDLKLAYLYGPEHGLRGHAEAGEHVDSEGGPVPIVSLYGKRKAPSKDELAGVDLFLVDLQDIGSRYYTYMATMKACLEACAESKTPVLILDRPNPLGGVVTEGPIAERIGSPVCSAKIPVRHGMTMGELARFFVEKASPRVSAKVSIMRLDNWERRLLFEHTALPWPHPSPNIPSAETALLYVGMCLFEGTNLNEGRGTPSPFHVFGAPWLDSVGVLERVPEAARRGCTLQAARYTPRSIPGKASRPRFREQECRGVRITVEDPYLVRPFTLAVSLISAVRHHHPEDFAWGDFFDTLAGTDKLRIRIDASEDPLVIASEWERELSGFQRQQIRHYA
jgi:uncharacterized protein YbbC (DUF1343 family)/CubicO group peptidase (beta-lactamase class C family)